jgi:outer membrane receptor protein involved in Fe transport
MFAQSTTQGAIGGTVFDTSNAVIANATVTIHNDATNAQFVVKTDASGYFKAPLVEPGTYTVSVAAASFGGYKATGVIVTLGQLSSLTPHLKAGGSSATVIVSAEAPVLNFDAPDFSSNINQRALENVPVNNMRWSSLALTTPGVVSDSTGFGLVSIRGVAPVLNNVLIDGADDNQAYYSEERGRTREAYSTPPEAIAEFQINTGVYSAQFGRAAGGVLNSITKSGTNKLHGDGFFYDRESAWGTFNPFATNTLATSNGSGGYNFNTVPIKPTDSRRIWGFTAGGDLIKDKLFWQYTYDQHHRNFPGTAKANSPTAFFAAPDAPAVFNAGATCNVTTGAVTGTYTTLDQQVCVLAARIGAANYAGGYTAYENGLATLLTDLGPVHRTGDQEVNMPKIDYQINSKNHVSVVYNRLRWDSPGGVQTQATNNYGVDGFGTDYVKLDYGVAKLTSQITSKISNELLYQYGRELNDEGQQPYSAFTKQYLTGTTGMIGNVPQIALMTSSNGPGFTLGSPYYSYRKALPDERKWQVGDTLYYSLGNHSLKFGVDIVHNYDLTNNTYESNGSFTYGSINNFISDALSGSSAKNKCGSTANATSVGTYGCYSSMVQGFGPPTYNIETMDYAGFVQDNWKITPRLSLEIGLRYDYESLPAPSKNLTTATTGFTPYTAGSLTTDPNASLLNHPSDKNNFGPRVGFAYNVFDSGRTVVRGGYGLYYGRIQNGIVLNLLENTGSPNGQYTISLKPNAASNTGNTSVPVTTFPNIEPTLAPNFTPNIPGVSSLTFSRTSNYLSKNLQNPQIHEIDLAIQQDLTKGNIFSISYLGSLGRELPNYLNMNLNPVAYNATTNKYGVTSANIQIADPSGKGPLPNGAVYAVPTVYGSNISNGYSTISEMISNINSLYNGVAFELQNRSAKSIQYDVSYTWSHALDYAQTANTSSTASNNWYDPYGKARANYSNSNYNVPSRIVGYVLYNLPNVKSGSPVLKYILNDWQLETAFQAQSGLPYSALVAGTNYVNSIALGYGYWNGISSEVQPLGRNTFKMKRDLVDDLRLAKKIKFTDRFSVEARLDVFNVANHVNYTTVTTGAYAFTTSGTVTTTGAAATNAVATFQSAAVTGSTASAFGGYTNGNASGFLYTPRQVQIGFKGFF